MENFSLTEEQTLAATHVGAPFRLLAGPGTGKTATLVARVVHLIEKSRVSPHSIHILTFTRAAARELRGRIEEKLEKEGKELPGISTLHSYALSKLIKAGESVVTLPQPIRIADDWEEREIIRRDLKRLCKFKNVREVKKKFDLLSACWHESTDPNEKIEQTTKAAKLLGEWARHRKVHGYSLRDELVYQLKLALERGEKFSVVAPNHLLVDEYQDLNRCDLDIILELGNRGGEVFVSGDDDQSIYGFRNADPEGIRRFCTEYPAAGVGILKICQRCAPNILALGEYVADLDPDRIEKNTYSPPEKSNGEVAILRFPSQDAEAMKIADICRTLLDNGAVDKASDILVLLRGNYQRRYSKPIVERLKEAGVPVVDTDEEKPLDRRDGRILLSFMRLAVYAHDSLAWRTLLQLTPGVGTKAIESVYECAVTHGNTFAEQIRNVQQLPSGFQKRIIISVSEIDDNLLKLFPDGNKKFETVDLLMESIKKAADVLILDSDERETVMLELSRVSEMIVKFTIEEIARNANGAGEKIEQETDTEEGVNIMTMHKAKGLTAKAVIVAGVEQERIPGDAKSEKEIGDQRRLLYVSLTRATNFLFMTYCQRRTGSQKFSGKSGGQEFRNLTEFLRDYRACKSVPGDEYVFPKAMLG